MSRPFVSVITPTYNRREFLPYLLHQFNYQTYPAELRELVILDDSPESNADLFPKDDPRIRYIHSPERLALGKKRNMLNKLAKGDIIVCMDDDDYYSPERVTHAVHRLQSQPKVMLAGCTELYIYYPSIDKIKKVGPYSQYHSTAGPLCYRKEYALKNAYPEDAHKAEESQFTKGFSEPLVQLDPFKTMICIAHGLNTVDKEPFIPHAQMTAIKIKDFFKKGDKRMIDRIKVIKERYAQVRASHKVAVVATA